MTAIETITRRIVEAERVFLFLDYDGTLAPIAARPDDAFPLPGVTETLTELTRLRGVQVAIVSGRTIADVRRFVDVAAIHYSGVHGLELQPAGAERRLTHATGMIDVVLPILRGRIERALGSREGVLIEDKGSAIACHYRGANRADAVATRQILASTVRQFQTRGVPVALNYGHEVAEVGPLGVNKGEAVRALLATCDRPHLAVCIGDDRTDADAFAALPPDGIAIHVGPTAHPPTAHAALPGPEAVLRLLRHVLTGRSNPVSASPERIDLP